jgi:choline-sulfatase
LGLLASTRIAYTSDHGELYGAQSLIGKSCLYEGSVGVPLIMAGPEIAAGHVSRELVSHVDLFPTFVETVGGALAPQDGDLHGRSLWSALQGREDLARPVFAEFHAQGSKAAAFMVRRGGTKMIHHVEMPPQLFDLDADPEELHDLAALPEAKTRLSEQTKLLTDICDPNEVDARAKAAQREKAEYFGGRAKVEAEPFIRFTPPPTAGNGG